MLVLCYRGPNEGHECLRPFRYEMAMVYFFVTVQYKKVAKYGLEGGAGLKEVGHTFVVMVCILPIFNSFMASFWDCYF